MVESSAISRRLGLTIVDNFCPSHCDATQHNTNVRIALGWHQSVTLSNITHCVYLSTKSSLHILDINSLLEPELANKWDQYMNRLLGSTGHITRTRVAQHRSEAHKRRRLEHCPPWQGVSTRPSNGLCLSLHLSTGTIRVAPLSPVANTPNPR